MVLCERKARRIALVLQPGAERNGGDRGSAKRLRDDEVWSRCPPRLGGLDSGLLAQGRGTTDYDDSPEARVRPSGAIGEARLSRD
jgi:hypothetical protein